MKITLPNIVKRMKYASSVVIKLYSKKEKRNLKLKKYLNDYKCKYI